LAGCFIGTSNITEVLSATLEVTSADADWDDESGRVEVKIDARIVQGSKAPKWPSGDLLIM
jgi:hypothetical protein